MMNKTKLFCLLMIVGLSLATLSWAGDVGQEPEAHQTATCSLCHQQGAMADGVRSPGAQNPCLSCHRADPHNRITPVNTQTNQKTCLSCHKFHDTGKMKTPDGLLASDSPSMSSGYCRGCHNPEGDLSRVSAAHRTAARLYHTAGKELTRESPSASCLRCHAAGSGSPWQTATGARIIAFNPHASHPYGVMVIPGAGNTNDHIRWQPDQRLPLFDGRMECQSCHLLSSGTKDDLVAYENPYDLCLGCHQHETGPDIPTSVFMATMVSR